MEALTTARARVPLVLGLMFAAGCGADDATASEPTTFEPSSVAISEAQPREPQPSEEPATAGGGEVSSDDDYLSTLRARLERSSLADGSALVASVPVAVGTAAETGAGAWTITLREPMSARTFADLFGWERPIGGSGDVHMTTWSVWVFESQLGPDRIASQVPMVGPWEVEGRLSARPAGELPRLRTGASAAYDLRERDALVVRITIRPPRTR